MKNIFNVEPEDLITRIYTLEEAGELLKPKLDSMTLYHFMRVKKMIYRNGSPNINLMKEGYFKSKKIEKNYYKTLITKKGLEYMQDVWSKTDKYGWA